MHTDNPHKPGLYTAISVNYHGLPKYLKKQAVKRAKESLGLGLSDLLAGRAEFRLSPYYESTGRTITEVVRTTIA